MSRSETNTTSKVDRTAIPPQIFQVKKSEGYVSRKAVMDEKVTDLDVSEGFEPFGPPLQYTGEIGSHYSEVDLTPAKQFIADRFGLGEDSEVVIGFQGSNEQLAMICNSLRDGTEVHGIGPHFTGFLQSIEVARRSSYGPISPPLDKPLELVLKDYMLEKKDRKKKPSAIYLCNPDARGDFASRNGLAEFIEYFTSEGTMVIVDESLGDFLQDNESVVNLTGNNSYLVVSRSMSKGIGLPGEGLSYVIAHKSYANEFKNQMRDHHYRGQNTRLANEIFRPEVIYPHLELVRRRTTEAKTALLAALDNLEIPYLPTSPHTPILFIDGGENGFWEELDLQSTPGSGFYETYDNKASRTPLTNRYARIGLPLVDYSDPSLDMNDVMGKIAKRIKGAIHVVGVYSKHIQKTI